jgi:Uri superfamily endonuclease
MQSHPCPHLPNRAVDSAGALGSARVCRENARMHLDLPRQGGTYVLVLEPLTAGVVPVGRLGVLHLQPGRYLYVGSAQGPGGLRARLARHVRSMLGHVPRHWHIDHLLHAAAVREIWLQRSEHRRECAWADALAAARKTTAPMSGFGASDCACGTHLLHVSSPVILPRLRRTLPTGSSGERVRAIRLD